MVRLRSPIALLTLSVALGGLVDRPEPGCVAAGDETAGGIGRPGAAEETSSRKGHATLYLRGGDLLLGRVGVDSFSIRTRYGDLRVPVDEVVQVRFARRLPLELRRKIESAILQLSETDFDLREAAMVALRSIGSPARSFLQEAVRSRDPEVRSRAGSLLAGIPPSRAKDEEGDLGSLRETEDDEVLTRRFTIRGSVEGEGYVVTTSYGELKVSRDQLTGILFSGDAFASRKVTVAASFTVPQTWYDTKVVLPGGSSARLTASGQVSVSNYGLSSGPEGTRRYSGPTLGNFPMLSLVGRIGKSGAPFLVGRECRVKVPKEGKLYLGIVPFRRNYPATGSYEVRIEAGR